VTPKRDFRADNVPQGRFRQPPKRAGRAYVAREEDAEEASGNMSDESQRIAEDVRVPTRESTVVREPETSQARAPVPVTPQVPDWTQRLADEMYRVVYNMGWRPPPPRALIPDRRFTENQSRILDSSSNAGTIPIGISSVRSASAGDTSKKTAGRISSVAAV
jgi:hypothetical protein